VVAFLIELLGALLDGCVPDRARTRLIGVLMLIAGSAFIIVAGFALYQGRPTFGRLFAALFLLALSAYCFSLSRKAFRQRE
jgi:hypothetical protein